MDYSSDIRDIVAFVNCYSDEKTNNYENCLERFTVEVENEPYLNERAKAILNEIPNNAIVLDAFKRLATKCYSNKKDCSKCLLKKFCNTYIRDIRKARKNSPLQMVDLFCGAGGLSLGFTQEGFTTALANDIEECCVETYAHNHPETPRNHIVLGDIRNVTDHLEELLTDKSIDIVVGGPPCQGFSMANRQRLIDDPRNHLYKNYVEIVSRVKPKFFVMENVKGMLSVADQVKEDFKRIGYDVEYRVLNAKDFGVPQNRERLIYIGNRVGVNNTEIFENISNLANTIPNYVLSDAIFSLRPLDASTKKNATEIDTVESGAKIERKESDSSNDYINLINQNKTYPLCLNHKARYNNDRDIEIFGRMLPGDKSDDPKIADIMPYSRRNGIFKDKYFKLEPDKVCKTITAHMKFDCNMYIHPSQARGLTPREAARVQSYPDDYYFCGAYTKTYMQIGNSVPPLLGRAIANCIKKYI